MDGDHHASYETGRKSWANEPQGKEKHDKQKKIAPDACLVAVAWSVSEIGLRRNSGSSWLRAFCVYWLRRQVAHMQACPTQPSPVTGRQKAQLSALPVSYSPMNGTDSEVLLGGSR